MITVGEKQQQQRKSIKTWRKAHGRLVIVINATWVSNKAGSLFLDDKVGQKHDSVIIMLFDPGISFPRNNAIFMIFEKIMIITENPDVSFDHLV